MKVSVYYRNGRLDMFDTQNLCAAEPWKKEGTNVASEFVLLLDDETMEAEGLMLEIYWYDSAIRQDTPVSGENRLPHAARQAGRRIRLAARAELPDVVKVTCDGELAAWRQGGELINGNKFSVQEVLCYSDATTSSINRRALALFDYLAKANPEKGDDEIAHMLGYTKDALDRITMEETQNSAALDDPGQEGQGEPGEGGAGPQGAAPYFG